MKVIGNSPLVSVIVPCYNMGLYIEETLNSVLSSSYSNIEIIVVNDGSEDVNTIKVLSKISNEKIKIINKENGGLVSARNIGVESSSGEIILPLDKK